MILLLVLCGILLNLFFLERYYIYKNEGLFIEMSTGINNEYINNRGNIDDYIKRIDRIEGMSCMITDSRRNVIYNSFPQPADPNAARLPSEIEQLLAQTENKPFQAYIYAVVEKPNDQAPQLTFIRQMTGGELMILRKPLKGVSESVSIANQFYLLAGLLMIFLGGVFTFPFARKITRPIIEMSEVAKNISNLHFDRRVTHSSQDEIGNLGRSINQMSEKLRANMDALKQDIELRKQLVRNISHELKTPIGVIKGYAEGLRFGVADDAEKTKKYCRVIADECDRMDAMVKELLNLSMLESGLFRLNVSRFDLGELIWKVSERFRPLLGEKGITLGLDIALKLELSADYELIERVVSNFLTNAIHHAEGANVIKVSAARTGAGTRISVFNSGAHIGEKDLASIWDVFYKVDQARSRQYGGHGLGLSIVKSIVDLHGGVVGVENTDGGVLFFAEIT